ncbi:hypothetical protein BC936DRAFT_141339, partial [Jimgerdemannia flammicorona]
LLHNLLHGVDVLGGRRAGLVEGKAILDLLLQGLAELGSGLVGEAVDTGGDGAFVGDKARDAALILGARAADEGRVVDQAVLGSVAFSLKGPVD